ncbi:phospholipase D-like domain-containing protein [Mycoplasmopsis columboralis]|uniref:Cardiolipin synthase n=1 Tax=Mycoplasmopsis columboralis TaxID=171282 RepID=A0A449B5N8_9BACT|nr:phospholipase D-like domain-containing protein [Mycoplasmopsis columboralis]VEU75885.1 Cardiolipin synthase [Mycoplasmopsis columboralis]
MKKFNFNFGRFLLFLQFFILFGAFIALVVFLVYNIDYKYVYLGVASVYLLNTIFVLIVYSQQRPTGAKLSWIYVFIIFPFFGHLMFLVFGLVFRNSNEEHISKEPQFDLNSYVENQTIENQHRYPKTLSYLETLDNNYSLPGNIKLFNEGYEFYLDLFKELKEAKESIFIVSYIIKNSEIFDSLFKIIKQKLDEGVKIKWILDDFGVMYSPKRKIKKLKSKGLEYKILGKIYYPFINAKSFSRNHEKLFIIDSKTVYTGGNNISDEYDSLAKKYGHWVDINYKLDGPIINKYNLHFAKFWKIVSGENIIAKANDFCKNYENLNNYKNDLIQVTDSPNLSYSTAEYYWIKMISNAKKEIKIATPYFAISEALKTAIILALKSNVKITIYFPGLPDKKLIHKISLSQLGKLQKLGLEIKIYQEVFMHSKMGLVDGKVAWIGSNNMDNRSLYSQYETMDILAGEALKEIESVFNFYDQKTTNLKDVPNLNYKWNKFEKFLFDWMKPLI